MIVTFILSQQNNIPRIKGLIRTLGERYGERRETRTAGYIIHFHRLRNFHRRQKRS